MYLKFRTPLFNQASETHGGSGALNDRIGDIELVNPSQASIIDDPMGGQQKQEPPPEKKETAPAASEKKEDAPPEKKEGDVQTSWTLDKFLNSIGAGFKEGDAQFNQFRPVKQFAEKVLTENQNLTIQLEQKARAYGEVEAKLQTLEAKLSTAEGKPGNNSEEITTLKAQIAKITEDHTKAVDELNNIQAKSRIEGHPEFKRRYEGTQARLLQEAKGVADQAKVGEDVLNTIFSTRGELAIVKAVKAAGITDPDAASLIQQKAVEWDRVQAEKDTLLSGATRKPTDILAEFEKYNADMGVAVGQKFMENLTGQLIAATTGASAKLKEQGHLLFSTPQGERLEEALRIELQSGKIFSAEDAVQNALVARTAKVWQDIASTANAEVDTLKKQIAALTGQLPGAPAPGAGDRGQPQQQTPATVFASQYERTGDIDLGVGRKP